MYEPFQKARNRTVELEGKRPFGLKVIKGGKRNSDRRGMTGPTPANDSSDNGSTMGTGPKPGPDQPCPHSRD